MTRPLVLSGVAALALGLAAPAQPARAHHEDVSTHLLEVAGAYIGEVMRPSGGDEAAVYRGLAEVEATLDLGRLRIPGGGQLHVRAQRAHGSQMTEELGTLQGISGIEAAPFTRIASAWLQYGTPAAGLRVRLGWQDANTDFAVSDVAGAFVHSSFGLPPTVGLPSYPEPALAATIGYRLSAALDLGIGVFEGTDGTRASTTTELRLRPAGSDAVVRIGGWGRAQSGGVFVIADGPIQPAEGTDAAVHGFIQLAWAALRAGDEPPLYVGGGLLRSAPLSFRPEDQLGFGLAHLRAPPIEPDTGSARIAETAAELFYNARLSSRISAQLFAMPLLPHGSGGAELLVGMRAHLTF